MFQLMRDDAFPLDNICYMLFTDFVQWYSIQTTPPCDKMMTSADLYIGKRMFHNKFVEYIMSCHLMS